MGIDADLCALPVDAVLVDAKVSLNDLSDADDEVEDTLGIILGPRSQREDEACVYAGVVVVVGACASVGLGGPGVNLGVSLGVGLGVGLVVAISPPTFLASQGARPRSGSLNT